MAVGYVVLEQVEWCIEVTKWVDGLEKVVWRRLVWRWIVWKVDGMKVDDVEVGGVKLDDVRLK